MDSSSNKVVFRRDSGKNPGGGVCAGIANYLNFDVAFIRVAFVLLAFASFGSALVIYFLLYFAVPAQEPDDVVAHPPGSRQEKTARIVAIVSFAILMAIGLGVSWSTLFS